MTNKNAYIQLNILPVEKHKITKTSSQYSIMAKLVLQAETSHHGV